VEVLAKAERRRFTAEYKRRILREAAVCTKPGEIGALLRREGLYTSHLSAWRRAGERGELAGLAPKKRGPQARRADPRDKRIAELERENRRLKARGERAEALLEVQKKVSALLGIEMPPSEER
jgi:transposase-like protein